MRSDDAQLSNRDGSVKSVERSIDLLLSLTSGPMTLTEASARTGLSKSTALRLLAALAHGGLVVRDPLTKSYVLGPGCLRLGHSFVSGRGGFEAFAREPLRRLWSQTGETVAVHVRLGRQRVCVDELPSAEDVRYVSEVGTSAPIHLGSAGRVLLAYLPAHELSALLEGVVLVSASKGTVMDHARFRKELAAVRQRGYALSEGERVRGAAAISVPVFGPGGDIASLSALGPAGRFTQRRRLGALDDLKSAATEIQEALRTIDPSPGPAGRRD